VSYLLVATGLKRETKIIARPGLVTIACGGHGAVLEAALEARIRRARPRAVMSIGIAGALDPRLAVGDILTLSRPGRGHGPLAPSAYGGVGRLPQGALASSDNAHSRLQGPGPLPLPRWDRGEIIGVDLAVTTAAAKAQLRIATGAAAVDMESHTAARVAARHDLPFAVIRVISDTAHHDLPPAACVPLKPDGGVDMPRVLAALARQPSQLPALLGLARDTEIALKVLADLLRRFDGLALDRLLGLDLGELDLDVLREDELGRTRVG
jgi:adenosylhomocysteine nucleosidase